MKTTLRMCRAPLGRALLLAAVFAACVVFDAVAARPPNVLLIMTDDQGWGDIGLHDNPEIDTPNRCRACPGV